MICYVSSFLLRDSQLFLENSLYCRFILLTILLIVASERFWVRRGWTRAWEEDMVGLQVNDELRSLNNEPPPPSFSPELLSNMSL